MPEERKNYLLGYGERLNEDLDAPRLRADKKHAYTFDEAKLRLTPKIATVADEVEDLPSGACPHDETVAALTLHPSYIAKSYFPTGLLRAVGLEAVGSRHKQIRPEKGAKKPKKEEKRSAALLSPTTELFVAGSRASFREWADNITKWRESRPDFAELIKIEDVRVVPPEERIKPMVTKTGAPLLEVVLHATDDYILEGFQEYLKDLDVTVDLKRRIQVGGLCFLPVRAPRDVHEDMAKFSFLRVMREMPKLRELGPAGAPIRAAGFPIQLPKESPLNAELKVAIFDGGVPKGATFAPWVNARKAGNVGTAVAEFQEHGLHVTSAFLFGPIEKGMPVDRPYAAVDHFRVLDEETRDDPQEDYFDVLERITTVLSQKKYEFVNLSIGPDLPIEDDDVHVWTVQLDQLFSDGKTLATVAVGNSGDRDRQSGNARIQAPSDGVNVLAIGACDRRGKNWKRASYSALGPGRSPGIVKPDGLAFGGSAHSPFWVVSNRTPGKAHATNGTSFASPYALRTAVGIRAHLGSVMQPIALKALLIHHGENLAEHDMEEVGWGRIPSEIENLVMSGPGVAHIIYQGQLTPGKYVRMRVPVPNTPMKGKVTITATFCYATETDPEDPVNYTRAGLDIKFRPNRTKFTPGEDGKVPQHPDTKPFFQLKEMYQTEEQLRRDAHQWETCLKRSRNFQSASLSDPAFDIHYNARQGGHKYLQAKPVPYALVVTVEAKNVPDLYDQIFLRYRNQLEPLMPVLEIPLQV